MSNQSHEATRLQAVQSTGLLDTPAEAEFDDLVRLASEICRTPISLFTLVDKKRQWFKAAVGTSISETPRDIAFCDHAIRHQGLFVVGDTLKDSRFNRNPLVVDDPRMPFYAGTPLAGENGALLGTLCVIDTIPRVLTESQRSALEVLAAQVRSRIELRAERRKLKEVLEQKNSALERLVESERRFRTFMNHAPFVSFMKDAQGRYIFYNDCMAERFKITSQQWLGKTDFDIWPKETAQGMWDHDLEAKRSRKMLVHIEETAGPGDEKSCWKTYKFPWWNERAEVMLGGFAVDLTQELARQKALEAANQELQRLATVDTLTGLSTRRVLDERLEFEFRYALRHKSALSVILMDLDDFKLINDRQGHAAGDEVLRHVGRCLKATMRATDLAARYGGEEFVVLLPGAGTTGAMLFARRLRKAMRAPGGMIGAVTASLGVASMKPSTTEAKLLIQRADEAMYTAKRNGKNAVVAYHDPAESHRQTLEGSVGASSAGKHDPAPPRQLESSTVDQPTDLARNNSGDQSNDLMV